MKIGFIYEGEYPSGTTYWYLTRTNDDRENHYYWNGKEIKECVPRGTNGWKSDIKAEEPFIMLDKKR